VSSLGFLTRDGEARVSGRESSKFSCMIRDLGWLAVTHSFDVDERHGPSPLRKAVDLADYATGTRGAGFAGMAALYLGTDGSGGHVRLPDSSQAATILEVHLNTILAARLTGQCEVNAWIAGEDRKWLADLIDAGRATRYPPEIAYSAYLRSNPLFADDPSINGSYDGWPGVVDFLRAGDSTVVLDSSITDGFPDITHAAWPADPGSKFRRRYDTYDPNRRWDVSEAGLRRRTSRQCPLLQISPTNLHDARFGITHAPTWSDVATAWRQTSNP
jgi:hypothetical protein